MQFTEHTISEENFQTALRLGFYEVLENDLKGTQVIHYKACLRTEYLNLTIYPTPERLK